MPTATSSRYRHAMLLKPVLAIPALILGLAAIAAAGPYGGLVFAALVGLVAYLAR